MGDAVHAMADAANLRALVRWVMLKTSVGAYQALLLHLSGWTTDRLHLQLVPPTWSTSQVLLFAGNLRRQALQQQV
jgi:hypothetical protein